MTILEVIIAITIFVIGVAFVLQMDAVSHKYLSKGQVRQQMLFYAAGILEAAIEGVDMTGHGFRHFSATIEKIDHEHETFADYVHDADNENLNTYLQVIKVTVSSPSVSDPVELYTYRVKFDEIE